MELGLYDLSRRGGANLGSVEMRLRSILGRAMRFATPACAGWFPIEITNEAHKLGINYMVYALTH